MGREANLESLDERHHLLILDQPIIHQQLPDFGIVHLVRRRVIRVLDNLHGNVLPFRDLVRNIYPHTLGLFGVERVFGRLLALGSLSHHLEQGGLGVADGLDGTAHVLASLDDRGIHRGFGCRPACELDGFGLLKDVRPDVFSEMGSNRGGGQGGNADPVEDDILVHANVQGDFTAPVTSTLEFIESVLENVLVVGSVRDE
jgi:hypothetical protein